MSEILVNTIKKADGTGGLTVPATAGNIVTTGGATFTGAVTGTDITLSGGVVFGDAGGGGTSTSNTLDSYEEGTFTPVVRDSSNTGTIVSFSVQNATYTKIGNIVTVSIFLNRTDAGSYSGTFYVTALPFTAKSGIAHVAGGAWFDASSSDKRAFAYIGGGQTHFIFPLAGATDSQVTMAQLPNGRPIYMGASYPVA